MHDRPHFAFVHKRCKDLPEQEIRAAEERFARLLDVLSDIAAREGTTTPSKFDSNQGVVQSPACGAECTAQNHGPTQGSFDF